MPAVCEPPASAISMKPSKVIWLIQNDPPPTPMCFDSRQQWQSYLMGLHESGEKITRVQDLGKWTTVNGVKVRTHRFLTTVWERVDYCADCLIGGERQLKMQKAGRCVSPAQAPNVSDEE